MRLKLALSVVILFYCVSAEASRLLRPVEELTTFGVMRVPVVGKINSQVVQKRMESITQPFNLANVLASKNVTIINPDYTTFSKLVPMLVSLSEMQADSADVTDLTNAFTPDELKLACSYERKIRKNLQDTLGFTPILTAPYFRSMDSMIIIPVQFRLGGFEIGVAKSILDLLGLRNCVMMHLNVSVQNSKYEPKHCIKDTQDWVHHMAWTQRKEVKSEERNGPHVTVYNQGRIMFQGHLQHGDEHHPGPEVLARMIIEQTRKGHGLSGTPKLTHFFRRIESKEGYNMVHSCTKYSNLGKGQIISHLLGLKDNNSWTVMPEDGGAYKFPRLARTKQ